MSKLFETFGKNCQSIENDNFSILVKEQMCPFSNGKCDKAKRHIVGVCSINLSNISCIICPKRFYENSTIFNDAAKMLKLESCEIKKIPEFSIENNYVDFILISSKNQELIDFLGMEVQALDTCGSMWKEIEKELIIRGFCFEESDSTYKAVSINWKTTAKTIISQIIAKAPYFEREKKHLVIVIQKPFFEYLKRHYNCNWILNSSDTIQIHIYDYGLNNNLTLVDKVSASLSNFRQMLFFDIDEKKTNLRNRLAALLLKQQVE